jgi:O-succinylbenzoic acid--CoA ligase
VLYSDAGVLTAQTRAERLAASAAVLMQLGYTDGRLLRLCAPASEEWLWALWTALWLDAPIELVDPHSGAERAAANDALEVDPHELAARASRHAALGRVGAPPAPWELQRTRAILSTSGSTGEPKRVPLTNEAMLFAALGGAVRLGHHLDDVWLCVLPPWQVGGLSIVVRAAILGTAVAWGVPYAPGQVWRALRAWPVTQLSLVPAMLRQVLDEVPEPFPPALRWALVGGGSCDAALLERAAARGLVVLPTWGMTESAAQVATPAPDATIVGPGVGPPLPFVDVVAKDDRLCLQGPQVSGRIATSDLGHLDHRGWVVVTGRADRQFKSGGKLVSPDVTERALVAVPGVVEAVAFSWPSSRWGAVLAVYVAADDTATTPLRAWAQAHLPAHQRPRVWIHGAPHRAAVAKVQEAQRDSLRRLAQTAFHKALNERGVAVDGSEGLEVHEGVLVLHGAELQTVRSLHPEAQGEPLAVELDERGDHDHSVSEPGRSPKSGFGAHEGAAHAALRRFGEPVWVFLTEHGLPRVVGPLEEP